MIKRPEERDDGGWRRRAESLPASLGIGGGVLTLLIGIVLWQVFDSVALGLVFAICLGSALGWWGHSRGAGSGEGRPPVTGPEQ